MDRQEAYFEQDRKILQRTLNDILSRELPDGGFGYSDAASFSVEATAWAVLALKASGTHLDLAGRACDKLARIQQAGGRVSAVNGNAPAAWLTPLCILAWKCLQGNRQSIDAGIQFLLTFKDRHQARATDAPAGHDTASVGWPWIEKTHSWIEATCLAMLALKAYGYNQYLRTNEAARMIMDRQLSTGGWNYGNTIVFGNNLLPIPENTGQALCALSGMTDKQSVQASLDYLARCVRTVRTPLALAWTLQGLGMWSQLPWDWQRYVSQSLELQNRYGPYNTVLLAQLVTTYYTGARIITILV